MTQIINSASHVESVTIKRGRRRLVMWLNRSCTASQFTRALDGWQGAAHLWNHDVGGVAPK
jgi:hypothetical protein